MLGVIIFCIIYLVLVPHGIIMLWHIERRGLRRATWRQLYGSVWREHRLHRDFPKARIR